MRRKTSKKKSILYAVAIALVICLFFSVPALAVTESEIQAQVDASGKETVAGNVLIWFLCAVAFLKVSQKIDSFMASLGVNVGHTGGSMLSEVIIATRAVSAAANIAGHSLGGSRSGSSGGSSGGNSSGTSPAGGVFRGGLAGMVSRAVDNNAMKTATENKAAATSVQADLAREAVYSAAHSDSTSMIHFSAPSPGRSGGSNDGGSTRFSGVSGGVSSAPNPIVQPEAGSGIPTAPSESSVAGGEGSPIPGSVPIGDANPISLDEAEEENEAHPIPTSDPGITIHAAPAVSTESGEGGASMESALQSPVVEAASGGAGITASVPGSSNGETASMPQSIQQGDPGIVLSVEPQSGGALESLNSSTETAVLTALAESGIGVNINTASETDASTVNGSMSENRSVPISSNPTNTNKSPGANPVGIQPTLFGAAGTVLRKDSQQRMVSSLSKESSSQTTQTQATHTSSSQSTVQTERVHSYGIGGAMFMKSLASGGSFANSIIGQVATGSAQTSGTISGEMASQAMNSYMGYAAIGSPPATTPTYTDVEIGGGRITGIETAPGGGQSIQFAMYHTDQYTAPQGDYAKVVSADGATWYKQYAQDTVDRKPYQAPDNTVAYKETIVQRMPNPPRRKDKI